MWKINAGKCSGNAINEVTKNKVSKNDNYNDELTSDNNDIKNGDINVVSESDTLKIDIDDVEIVSESERVMGCKGVETNVYQLEREREREHEESVQVEGWQRVKFSLGVVGGEERSSRMYWVDKCATNKCLLNFCVVPGGIRRCFNIAVPSAWSERDKVIWRYGERYLERELFIDEEIELFVLSRNYEELIERLEVEKIYNMKCLPYEMKIDD